MLRADVVVVGAGAAGVFSAITAARRGASVVLLESGSKPLRKVRVSGGGRCNVMHDAARWAPRDAKRLLGERYPRGAEQFSQPLTRPAGKGGFGPHETARWFEAEGVTLVAEDDGRCFPSTNDSATW